jgi:hypothetical protein
MAADSGHAVAFVTAAVAVIFAAARVFSSDSTQHHTHALRSVSHLHLSAHPNRSRTYAYSLDEKDNCIFIR